MSGSPITKPAGFATYERAVAKINGLIGPEPPDDGSPGAIRQRAEQRLDRVRRFLAFLGDPHLDYPIVHVGGTSGKGSTSTAIASILSAAGYRVGLHTSPYLQVATEKLALGDRLIGADAFAGLVDDVLDAMDRWRTRSRDDPLTYGELWVALTTRWLARERVDIAVIEVGAGGRFDLTNVVHPAVSVITSVGLDHVATLGNTLSEIAWHKAGIVKTGAPAITGVTAPEALAAIEEEVATVGTTLTRVVEGVSYRILHTDRHGARWTPIGTMARTPDQVFVTPLPGRFQVVNAALALAAVDALAARGFGVSDDALALGLRQARLPGRSETMPGGPPRVVLDGAHNPDKIVALASSLPLMVRSHRPLVVVFGALASKGAEEMLGHLLPDADAMVLTEPRVLAKSTSPPLELATMVRASEFAGPVHVESSPLAALEIARTLAGPGGTVLVTGSLYLVGNVRGRWYPDAEVVVQQTPWPVTASPPPSTAAKEHQEVS